MSITSMVSIFKSRAHPGSTFEINGRRYSGTDLSIDGDGVVTVDGVRQDGKPLVGPVNVTVYGNATDVETTSGDITVRGACGTARTVSGNIHANDVEGGVSTVSGDVSCASIAGSVSTVSGDVRRPR